MTKRGVVYLVEEEEDVGPLERVFTGRFHGSHQGTDRELGEITGVTAEEGIAWGRERADRVWVRLAGSDVHYAAGDDHADDEPRWPPDVPIRRRRPAGEEWRERSERDPPMPWIVEVDLSLPYGSDEKAVRTLAEQTAAASWRQLTAADDGDLAVKALRTADPPPAGFEGFEAIAHRLTFLIVTATADQAMDEALARCASWPRWAAVAWARPADAEGTRAIADSHEEAAPNPRAPRRRSSAELTTAVRQGRRFSEALAALSDRAEEPDGADLRLAEELARMLVRRCDTRHQGWQTLRDALQEAGADVPWSRAERQAVGPTTRRVLADCATAGRTPLVRVQHAAAEERARALAPHLDPKVTAQLGAPDVQLSPDRWPDALAAAVRARSRSGLATHLRAAAADTT